MPAKKTRVTDKIESSEDKLKNPLNALYFMQGREMIFEGLDWLSFVKSLDGLDDAAKLARLAELAQSYKAPKVSIRTVALDESGKVKEVKHTDVPLMAAGEGKHRLTVPDLFPRDGAEKYLICDTIFYADSFTKDDHIAWETFHEEQGLNENIANQTIVRRNLRSAVPSDDEMDSLRKEIPDLVEARDAMLARQKAAFNDTEVPAAEVEQIVARVKLANTRLKDARAQLYAWEDESQPLEIARKTAPMSKELEKLEAEVNRIFATFAHMFATEKGMTAVTLEEWLSSADEQDYSNAIQWITLGNVPRMLGRIAKPLTREEERARELAKVLN